VFIQSYIQLLAEDRGGEDVGSIIVQGADTCFRTLQEIHIRTLNKIGLKIQRTDSNMRKEIPTSTKSIILLRLEYCGFL
jgi:hypothetical protein